MATNSKYIQLTSSVLMEYIYADQAEINNPGNTFRISTLTNPIWLCEDLHNKKDIVLNADSSEFIQQGLPNGTGNVRNRSYAFVDNYKSALLDIDKVVFYNDYDPKLTPTASLPIPFTNPSGYAPVYDTIRLHLVQGFNFETYEGLILNVQALRKDNTAFNLLNWVFNREDTWEILNPNSFFFAGRVYDSYIEVRVLSLYNLIYDYWLGTLTGDTVAERVTRQIGIKRDQQIQVNFSWIREKKTIEDQDYIYLYDTLSVDIPTQDQFESIAAVIQDSTDGDYVEFYATYKGNIIQQFILDLNSNGYDFILLHDLTISEYIWDSTSNQYYWVKTDDIQISQISDYGEPNFFRPVIKNPSAISYKIDYVVRLYNRNDNSQIWKTASMISNSPAKYGRKLLQLNLGLNPIQTSIFNKNVVKEVQINRIAEPVLDNAKYITSFLDNTQVSVSYESINPDSETLIGTNTLPSINKQFKSSVAGTIYANGLARVLVSDSVCFLKFVIFQKNQKSGNNVPMNLSGIGEIILSFISDTNEDLDILEFPSTFTSKSNGEIVFRLTEPQAKQILAFTNRQFRLFLKNPKGERTFLYNGKWYNQTEWMNLAEANKVADLELKLNNLTGVNGQLMAQVTNQSNMISNLNSQLSLLTKQLTDAISADKTEDAQFMSTIGGLNSQITAQQQTIETLTKQVNDINASLSLAQSQVLSDQGMIAALQQQLASQSIVLGATSMTVAAPIKAEPAIIKDLQPVKANIQTTPATTYTQQGGGGCFLPGTKITLADKTLIDIEDVVVGDTLLTYNIIENCFEPGVVKKLIRPKKSNIITVKLSNGTRIHSTEEHPYFVQGKGWCSFDPTSTVKLHEIEVDQLLPGDTVIDDSGNTLTIERITPVVSAETQTVYNFEIDGNHTYFANGILVHNKRSVNYGGGSYTNYSGFSGYGW
jgi:uncharacterized coiled-coil protein SlyX